MALIRCPECGREISTRAAACPGCGCPVTEADRQLQEAQARDKRFLRRAGAVLLLAIGAFLILLTVLARVA